MRAWFYQIERRRFYVC